MAKYSKRAGEKVKEVMHEKKEGKLKSGSGKKVTSRKQAIAIGYQKQGKKVQKFLKNLLQNLLNPDQNPSPQNQVLNQNPLQKEGAKNQGLKKDLKNNYMHTAEACM